MHSGCLIIVSIVRLAHPLDSKYTSEEKDLQLTSKIKNRSSHKPGRQCKAKHSTNVMSQKQTQSKTNGKQDKILAPAGHQHLNSDKKDILSKVPVNIQKAQGVLNGRNYCQRVRRLFIRV